MWDAVDSSQVFRETFKAYSPSCQGLPMNADVAPPVLNDQPGRSNVSGPRYTSFPTVDRFVEAFAVDEYRQALAQRRSGPTVTGRPMSLYVHIPFCETLCYFCACNKVVTRQHGRTSTYLNYLTREVELHTAELGIGQPVSQLHVGGGTPTFLNDTELRDLMSMLRRNFKFVPGAGVRHRSRSTHGGCHSAGYVGRVGF